MFYNFKAMLIPCDVIQYSDVKNSFYYFAVILNKFMTSLRELFKYLYYLFVN